MCARARHCLKGVGIFGLMVYGSIIVNEWAFEPCSGGANDDRAALCLAGLT